MQIEGSVCRSESKIFKKTFLGGNSHMWMIKVSNLDIARADLLTAFAQSVCL